MERTSVHIRIGDGPVLGPISVRIWTGHLTAPSVMSSPPTSQPHLVSLVLQSKKALQHGEHLCSRAHAVSNNSARISVDVVALDAKVHWVRDAVAEQLQVWTQLCFSDVHGMSFDQLVATVAKSIEEKRADLHKQVQVKPLPRFWSRYSCPIYQAWDALRTKHSGALDDILEQLGSQRVPSDFYQTTSLDSSLFGSQRSDEGPDKQTNDGPPSSLVNHSPSSTLRQGLHKGKPAEKEKSEPKPTSSWKTLRDFVDDQAIEDVLENIENDRLALDVCSLAPHE